MTSQEIKKALSKAVAGTKPADYKVSHKSAGYSDVYYIRIKHAHINILEVEKIAKHLLEHIDRDERTGEILQGSNDYVFVSYDDQAKDQVCEQFAANFKRAILKDWGETNGVSSCRPFGDAFYNISEDADIKIINIHGQGKKPSLNYQYLDSCTIHLLSCGYFNEMCEFIKNNA